MKHLLIIVSLLLSFGMAKAQVVDSVKMAEVEKILCHGIDSFCAKSGQVIIMDSKTGRIVATKGSDMTKQHPSSIVRVSNLLAALETEKVSLDDIVNTKNGVLKLKGFTLKDHNWRRGGYEKITVRQGLTSQSNIANYKTVRKAWGNDTTAYFSALQNIGYGLPNNYGEFGELPKVRLHEIAYYANITPLQTLTFVNAIANNGMMLQPQADCDSTIVIKEQIASKETIAKIQDVLRDFITDGLGRRAGSNKVKVAGYAGTAMEEDGSYRMEFCGYLPIDNPQYTVIVTLNKDGLPASGGGMAGGLFKEVAELLTK